MTENGKNGSTPTLFDLAHAQVVRKQQWPSGDTVSLHQAGDFEVVITEGGRDGGGLLFLLAQVGRWPKVKHVAVQCGLLGAGAWVWSLDEGQYAEWVARCQRAIKAVKRGC